MEEHLVFGKEVTADQANRCIQSYRNIAGTLKSAISNVQAASSLETTAAEQYIANQFNAFIFDKKMVERYFTDGHDADFLMVILGAQPQDDAMLDFKENDPTVVLVGCKKVGDEFFSLAMENPATEHPPKGVRTAIPPVGSEGDRTRIQFTFM